MEPWVEIFIRYFGLLLISIGILSGVGKIMLFLISPLIQVRGFYQKVLFSLALGIFSAVVISSLAITHFITISLGLLLIVLFLIYELYKFKLVKKEIFSIRSMGENPGNKNFFFKISWLLILSLFFFSWQAVMILKNGAFPFVVPDRDRIFYSDLSEMIWKTGQENTYLAGNLISKNFSGITLYHYFEMWLGAFFSFLYGIENLLSMQLIVLPVFYLMMALSVFSVAENLSTITLKKKVIFLPLLFIGGIPLIVDESSGLFQWVTYIESPVLLEKAAHHYWIAMMGFLFILNQFFTGGFIVFLSLLFVSGATFPGIAGGGVAFLIVSHVFKLQLKKELMKQSVYFFSCLLFFVFFHLAFGNNDFNFQINFPFLYYTDLSPVMQNGFTFFTLKVFLAELATRIYLAPLEMILILLPLLMIVFFFIKRRTKFQQEGIELSVMLIGCIYFSSIICSGIFYKLLNGGAFPENIYFFILSMIVVLFLIFWSSPGFIALKRISAIMIFLIFIFKISNYLYNRKILRDFQKESYSDEYLLEISKIKNEGNPVGVFFRRPPGPERITGRNSHIALRTGGYTNFFPGFSTLVDLSLMEMTDWDVGRWGELEQAIVKTSIFYQYVEDQKKRDKFRNIAQSQGDFIDEYGIKYVIVAKNAKMNPLIEERAKKVINDSKSGERFLILE